MADKKVIEFTFDDKGDDRFVPSGIGPDGPKTDKEQIAEINKFYQKLSESTSKLTLIGTDPVSEAIDQFSDFLKSFPDDVKNIMEAQQSFIEENPDHLTEQLEKHGFDLGLNKDLTGDFKDEPYDPFASTFGGQFTADTQKWLDDLAAEYEDHMRVIEKASEGYDELTAQADALGATTEEVVEADVALIGTLGEFGAVLGVVITAAFAFNKAVNEMVEAVGGFSAQVVEASTRSRIQEIEDRIRLAEEAGGDIASLENIRNQLAHELRNIFREGIELLSPVFEVIGKVLTEIIREIRVVVETLSGISHIIEKNVEIVTGMLASILGDLPFGIGTFFRKLDAWMRKDDQIDNQKSLNQLVDDLFDPKNF